MVSLYGGGSWVNYGWELFEHVIDARAASMGNATTGYYYKSPTSSLINPIFSSRSIRDVSITHQSRFAGIVNSDLVSFQLDRNNHSLQFNFLYEGIGQIPDTRSMLLDWGNDGQFGTNDIGEGNGVLDEGERLDIEKLKYFSQHQFGMHSAFVKSFRTFPFGFGMKILSSVINNHSALGIGFDIGLLKKIRIIDIGLVLRNFPASGLIWDNGSIENSFSSFSIGAHHASNINGIKFFVIHSMINCDIGFSNRHIDSQFKSGSLSIDTSFGFEGIYKDRLFFRLGRNNLSSATGGLGIKWNNYGIDYAFLSLNSVAGLGSHHLISLNFSLDWVLEKFYGSR